MRKWTPVPRHPNVYSYETKKGKKYGVRRVYLNSEGVRTEYTKSGFKNWHDAEICLKNADLDLLSGKQSYIENSRITLGEYWVKLRKRKIENGIWRETTIDSYDANWRKHLEKPLGRKPISQMTHRTVQPVIDAIADKGLALESVRGIYKQLTTIVNNAVQDDIIEKNKLGHIILRGKDPRPKDVSVEDYQTWIAYAQTSLRKHEYAMICIASLGLRAGELLGLRTTSIKFDDAKGSAEIIIDLQRNRFNELGAPLKTKDSYRKLWVNGEIVDVLKYCVMYSNNIRKANFISMDSTPWLWVNQYGAPVNSSALAKVTSKVSSGVNIRVTPHMLRHFFATQAIASNAPAIDVMHWLGHSSIQMTADYTRQTKEAALNVYDGFNGTW